MDGWIQPPTDRGITRCPCGPKNEVTSFAYILLSRTVCKGDVEVLAGTDTVWKEGAGADMRWWNYQNSLYGPILQFYGFKLDDLLKVWIHYGNRQCALLWVIPTTQDLPQKTFIQYVKIFE